MSLANVEFIKERMPAEIDMVEFFSWDVSAIAEAWQLAPDFEVMFISNEPAAEMLTYRGAEGLVEGWRDWMVPYESYHVRIEDPVDAGDEVITVVRAKARTSRDGVLVEHSAAAAWTVKDGRVARARFFLNPDDILPASD